MLDSDEMREIFQRTQIIRRPTYGIVSGYHELPYICVGSALKEENKSVEVRGKIQVSPRFVIRPTHYQPSYGDIFGEENVDRALLGRIFGFLGFRGKPVDCKSEHIEVRHTSRSVDQLLSLALDELERQEDITTGVIVTPDSRYYPISIERFITSVLEDEFRI
jgi:hypothetical protein